jgi:hypothetical protein
MSKYLTRSFLRKLDPQVYEEAAERISAGQHRILNGKEFFSCDAIVMAETNGQYGSVGMQSDYLSAYAAFFEPKTEKEKANHPFWNRGLGYVRYSPRQERRFASERRMALLTMAAVVRAARS